jgi:hypothetical protein
MKNVLLLLLVAVLLGVAALSCSDGKLNLLLFVYGDDEEKEPGEIIEGPIIESSSSEVPLPPSSSSFSSSSLSSSEEPLPISSSSIPALSSSSVVQPPRSSSSNKSVRSSTSVKVNRNGEEYVDYPTLDEGAPGVTKGHATRYRPPRPPHCSREEHVKNTQPWAICKNCDKNNNEMPAYYLHPEASVNWPGMWLGTPSGCNPHDMDLWQSSQTYRDWVSANPAYPPNSPAYTCWDQAPHVINDTLAYAFAATSMNGDRCGKCYMLQFDGGENFAGIPRDAHRALKGKTLVVLSSNVGGEVEENQFDIMIPGGGLGAFTTGFPTQLGIPADDLGKNPGGLLSSCIAESGDYYKIGNIEYLQNCIREKCRKVFGNKSKDLLDGCLFIADWYMAADNPTLISKEVECPQYLVDKYRSKIHTEKPPPLGNW